MANSFTQIYVHYVWAVKSRRNFLIQKHNDELQKYTITEQTCKFLKAYSYGITASNRKILRIFNKK